MDTSTVLYQKPEAIDFSHHLSLLARERLQSPLKVSTRFGPAVLEPLS
jgi:hypothetical protein